MSSYIKGSLIRKIKTSDDYIRLVESAREDIFDLRDAIEYDGDEMARASVYIDSLQQSVEALYQSFKDGTYEFEDKDLPFMEIVRNNNNYHVLPMIVALKQMNRIHREGLDVEEDK